MNPFEKYACYTQSHLYYQYQQDQKERIDKCEMKFLEFLKEISGLDEQHKQECLKKCFRDTCLAAGFSISTSDRIY